jgi:hypothetical protein
MNLQIHHVIDDITGMTGLAIVDAILAGKRDPVELAKLRNWRIKASEETIRKSLVGNWREEHLFTLRQSRELYRSYQNQISKCDQPIEKLIGGFEPRVDPETKPLPPGPEALSLRQEESQKSWPREFGIQPARRSVQAIWRGCHPDPRTRDDGIPVVRGSRPGYVEVADSGPLCFLAGTLPGQ